MEDIPFNDKLALIINCTKIRHCLKFIWVG